MRATASLAPVTLRSRFNCMVHQLLEVLCILEVPVLNGWNLRLSTVSSSRIRISGFGYTPVLFVISGSRYTQCAVAFVIGEQGSVYMKR
jgi:hypothetical protein